MIHYKKLTKLYVGRQTNSDISDTFWTYSHNLAPCIDKLHVTSLNNANFMAKQSHTARKLQQIVLNAKLFTWKLI